MRDGVEVFRQIGVHHVGIAPAYEPVHFFDGIGPAAARPIAVSAVLEVRLEDRFQHQLGGGLNHPIPDRRDAERAFAAPRLRDHHPPHRRRPVSLLGQFLPHPGQPLLQARLLDRRKGHPVHARRPRIGAGQLIGMVQDIFPTNLVVEQIEAVVRLCLRLAIELPLKDPDLYRCCQVHHQSPDPLPLQKRTRSQGPSLPRRYPASSVLRPRPTPAAAAARCRRRGRYPRRDGSPPLPRSSSRRAVPITPADRTGAYVDRFPARVAFPVSLAGRHPRLHFRGLLRLSLALRPAGLLNRPRRPLSRGFDPASYPTKPLVSYQTYRLLSGWILPPLVIRALAGHTAKSGRSRSDHQNLGATCMTCPGLHFARSGRRAMKFPRDALDHILSIHPASEKTCAPNKPLPSVSPIIAHRIGWWRRLISTFHSIPPIRLSGRGSSSSRITKPRCRPRWCSMVTN